MGEFTGLDFSYFLKKEDLDKEYEKYLVEDLEICKQLEKAYLEKDALLKTLSDLSVTMNNIHVVESNVKELSDIIKDACDLSGIINKKMKKIDIGTNNVILCQKRVNDLLDLQFCSNGIQTALQNEDFETAAGHIHRFLLMDQHLLKKSANDLDQDCEIITNSVKLLRDSTAMLQNKISLHFKEAITINDIPKVEHFFKLFPLVGMRNYGLELYSGFLCSQLRNFKEIKLDPELKSGLSGKKINSIFFEILTSLFEEIARILESKQPLIETYYGSGNLLEIIKFLQKECDIHVKNILSTFRKIRSLDQIISNISESSSSSSRTATNLKNEYVEAKNLDTLLDEIVLLHSRYQLYRKFVRKKISNDSEENKIKIQEFEFMFSKSETCRLMQELIKCQYRVLERYYMEENIKKAILTDSLEEGSQVTSVIDNTFFIIRKCIHRAYSTGAIDAVCTVIDDSCSILEIDLCEFMKKKLKQGYSSGYLDFAQAYNVMLQAGRLQQSDPEITRLLFIANLNNSSICMEYTTKLCETIDKEICPGMKEEKEKLESCIYNLKSVTNSKFKSINEYGLQQLQITVIKSRVVPWVDSFLTFNHQLSQEEFLTYETDEPFIRKLITELDGLLSEFKPRLLSANYEAFFSIIVNEVVVQMEKVILKSEFTRMGGLALDKEIRMLVSYLSNVTSWSVRDKFSRLIQIATILNLEKLSEISEYVSNSSATFKLTAKEIRQFLALRKDFQLDDINQLRLT